MTRRLKLVLVFGGQNSEHEVSLKTAKSVFENLNQEKYEIKLIFISKTGKWFFVDSFEQIIKFEIENFANQMDEENLKVEEKDDNFIEIVKILRTQDWKVFPLLHGKYGEDGTIQGFFEMLGVNYVGCGVLSSSAGMDKEIAKKLFQITGLKTAKSLTVHDFEDLESCKAKIIEEFSFPVFIKPARQGSSVGINKVYDQESLTKAIEEAFKFDTKILVEEFIQGREVECAVLGKNEYIQTSVIGEITPKTDFYSYETKYTDGQADLIIPAILENGIELELQRQAKLAFEALNCKDLARVDFFLTKENEIYINEINTLPGFTSLSMYPSLWQASGLSFTELLDRLIEN
jgi:D-alanine-D-alanine ligase